MVGRTQTGKYSYVKYYCFQCKTFPPISFTLVIGRRFRFINVYLDTSQIQREKQRTGWKPRNALSFPVEEDEYILLCDTDGWILVGRSLCVQSVRNFQ